MPTVKFHNSMYTFGNEDLHLQYFDSGDLHGNDNFRMPDKNPPVYEVLNHIDPTLLQNALAATIDEKPVSLTTKISKDCSLDVITLENPIGKTLYHQTLAFLIAQTIYATHKNTILTTIEIDSTYCKLQFATEQAVPLTEESLGAQLSQVITDNAAIQLIDAFQKEMLLETYPSLSQLYAKNFLADYDDYDFVTVAVRQNFVLPIPDHTILVTNPTLIKDYSITVYTTASELEIVASYQHT